MENFFRRLEIYTEVPPTPAMTDMMVKIMVEVLDILAIATKEMKQSRASMIVLRFTLLEAHIGLEKILKRVAGITNLEDGLKKLDKMTNEEARMANAEVRKLAHGINKKVEGVDEKVKGIGAQVKHVEERVQDVHENVKVVEEKMQIIIGGGKPVFGPPSAYQH